MGTKRTSSIRDLYRDVYQKAKLVQSPLNILFIGLSSLFSVTFFFAYYKIYEANISSIFTIFAGIIGLFFLLFSFFEKETPIIVLSSKVNIVLILCTLGLLFIAPFPANIALFVGVLWGLVYKLNRAIAQRFLYVFETLSFITILYILFYRLVLPKIHSLNNLLILIVKFLVGIFAMDGIVEQGSLRFANLQDVPAISVSFESLLLGPVLMVLAIFLFLLSRQHSIKRNYYLYIIGVSVGFIIIRFVLITTMSAYVLNDPIHFWGIKSTFISLAFYLLALSAPLLKNTPKRKDVKHNTAKPFSFVNSLQTIILGTGVLFVLLGYYGEFHTTERNGAIYIDELHSYGWESITEPLDTENFGGQKSTYTYTSLVSYLNTFGEVKTIDFTSDYEQLNPEDILIIKTATQPFNQQEINKIINFVKDGGALFLIGDHTNLLNMSRHMNEVSKNFGILFNYDATYDSSTTGLTTFKNNFPFFDSSIVKSVPTYEFATSCSISSSLRVRSVIQGNAMTAEKLDITTPHFFNNMTPETSDLFGIFEQCVSVNFGKGKVTAYSDSTTFSSFSVFMHNNPEFITSLILDLKSHSNTLNTFFTWFGFAILICSILYIVFRNTPIKAGFIIIIVFSAMVISNAFLHKTSELFANKVKDKVAQETQIVFLHDDDIIISHFVGMSQTYQDYSSLFIAFQRKNYFLREKLSVSQIDLDSLGKDELPEAVVLLSDFYYSEKEKDVLINYAKKGGKIIIFDNDDIDNTEQFNNLFSGYAFASMNYISLPINISGTVNSEQDIISNNLEISTEPDLNIEQDINTVGNITEEDQDTDANQSSNSGIEPTIWKWTKYIQANDLSSFYDESTLNISAHKFPVGEGSVIVVFNAISFSNVFLGDPGIPPTGEQIDRHDVLFDIIDFSLR
ncbi:MAG: hypothetical protein LBR68_05180 [Lachnoclostridium sp.]|jgi:hypothetical protein|nr:hypothetical protein [Lachnoclostridium sp.]